MINAELKNVITPSQSSTLTNTTIRSLSEEKYASLSVRAGVKVVEHRGAYLRHAEGFGPLLLVPTHWMGVLSPEQAILPPFPCMILKTRVGDSSESVDGAFNLHRLRLNEGEHYWDKLTGKMRRKIKKTSEVIFVEQIDQPEAFRHKGEGYSVLASALRRNNYREVPKRVDYEEQLEYGTFLSGERLILGGYQEYNTSNQKLVAYIAGSAIGKVAYIDEVCVGDEGLKNNAGTKLVYTFVEICERSGITDIIYGRVTPEDPNLVQYKELMKFPGECIPAKVFVRPSIKPLIAFVTNKKPHYQERLYGNSIENVQLN